MHSGSPTPNLPPGAGNFFTCHFSPCRRDGGKEMDAFLEICDYSGRLT